MSNQTAIKLLVGLGNPGKEYENTRHNIGFAMLDSLSCDFLFKSKFNGEFATQIIGRNKVILFKPATYMNNSGSAVVLLQQFYKIDTHDILVVHDEIDLEVGRCKIKQGGSHAGHNGLKSLDKSIGQQYWRMRIGVSKPGTSDVSRYVLSRPTTEEISIIGTLITKAAQNMHLLIAKDKESFLNSCYSNE